jgi:histidinol-phosphate aminotransferase
MTPSPTFSADADAVAAVLQLARADILALEPYRHASADRSSIRLHANESPWPPVTATTGAAAALNHYPPPQPPELLEALARAWGVTPTQILVGRGSDEGIDLLTRAFCTAGQDSVMVSTPTFGMYAVAARIQGASILDVPLLTAQGFAIDLPGIRRALDAGSKILWLCSPNNPTGNTLGREDIEAVLAAASGRAVVVVDEAYIEFTGATPWTLAVARFPHLITLRTMSKAHGLAGARLGALIAHPDIIGLLRRIVPPYAVAGPTLEAALAALSPAALAVTAERIGQLVCERERLAAALSRSTRVSRVFPSDANFLLVQFDDAGAALQKLRDAGVLVRDFRGQSGLGEVLRLTVGTPSQNDLMIRSLT